MAVLAVGDEVDERLLGERIPDSLREVRLLLSCGDLPADYLEALVDRFQVPLLYVRGNHDRWHRESLPPGENIHGRLAIVRGLRILGFEGSNWYNGAGVQYTERQMWWRVAAARPAVWRAGGVDVVLTHTPPLGVHDGRDVSNVAGDDAAALLCARAHAPLLHSHGRPRDDRRRDAHRERVPLRAAAPGDAGPRSRVNSTAPA